MKKLISGNEAVALGALAAGITSATGYPGTPSTGALASLMAMQLQDVHVEWSTNEKVALEIAAGVAWAGKRAFCTMKMSGVNVASDSLIAIAYSGVEGGLVIYVADDPGVSAGCCEQDTRGFALMADLPILEPASVEEAYGITRFAFELSEQVKTPVFVRLVTALANSYAVVEVDEPGPAQQKEAKLIRDIERFTKAGALISMNQHRDLICRLDRAGELIRAAGLNRLELSPGRGGLGILAVGIISAYLEEAFEVLEPLGFDRQQISILQVGASHPFPTEEVRALLSHCTSLLVLEELEPHIERGLYVEAQKARYVGSITGKLDGQLSRVGEYGVRQVVEGAAAALHLALPEHLLQGYREAEQLAAARPITVCAGCPHRGTYMAINQAIRKMRLKPAEVIVTGDIGCTILGMNPPFNTVWTEISMGASIPLAQGYERAGVQTPIIATIGDSTFFHGGLPGLINAVQHRANLTVIVMDNRWTAMTGMQPNPGTPADYQGQPSREVDLGRIIPALGVDYFCEVNPFDLEASTQEIQKAMSLPGVKVLLSRQECAIPAARRVTERKETIRVIEENCNLCKLCILLTGCAAIGLGEEAVTINDSLCVVCGLCIDTCHREALVKEQII